MTPRLVGALLVAGVLGCPSQGRALLDPDAFASLGSFDPAGDVTVDTDQLSMSGAVTFVGVEAGAWAVFDFDQVALAQGVTVFVTGARGFALLSRAGATIDGTLDARGATGAAGPSGPVGGTDQGGIPGEPGSAGGDGMEAQVGAIGLLGIGGEILVNGSRGGPP